MTQLIFVVETNKRIQSDNAYIIALLKLFFPSYKKKNITINFSYMDGKGNHEKASTKNQINGYILNNKKGKNIIFYIFDTDNIRSNIDDLKTFEKECNYCKQNSYLLIWFNPNIEYVLLKKSVPNKNKKSEAFKFLKNLPLIDRNLISSSNDSFTSIGKSNFLTILEPLFKRFK